MQKSSIRESALRHRVGELIFERGRRYAAQGRVSLQRHDPAGAEAVVAGSEDYLVEIEMAQRGLGGSCTCPFAEEGHFCKHMIAAVLTWIATDEEEGAGLGSADSARDDDSADDTVPSGAAPEYEDLLREHLAQQPLGHLVDALLEAAERDSLLRARLLVEAGTPAEAAFDETQAQRDLVNAFSIDDFVHYRDAGDYFWGIGEALDGVEDLVDQGFGASAARLALYALDLLEEFGHDVDDSDGGSMIVIEQIEQIHLRASGFARQDPEALAATLVGGALDGDYEVFNSAAADYAEILGERGLSAYRDLVEQRWRALPAVGDRFDVGRFATRHLREQVAQVIGGADALLELLQDGAAGGIDHLRIARLLHQEGRVEEALERIAQGLETGDADQPLRELAARIHREAGRPQQAGELLWQNFVQHPGVPTYRTLSTGTGADFPRWRDRALAVLADPATGEYGPRQDHSDLVAVLLWEGEAGAAWEAAHEGGCRPELWLAAARARAVEHPGDAVPVLLREAERVLAGGDRRAYRHSAGILGEARRLAERSDGLEEFAQHVRRVRERNRRRPALQDEFTRAGLP